MKTVPILRTLMAAAILSLAGSAPAQDPPPMPQPTAQHRWLEKLTGEWHTKLECNVGPDAPPMKMEFTEQARMLGGFWLLAEGKGEAMGQAFGSVLTLGYDPSAKRFTGTWVDSMTSHLWRYEGELDEATGKLALHSEGPCPMLGGKICKFREVITIDGADRKTFTSQRLDENGSWTTLVTAVSTRKG